MDTNTETILEVTFCDEWNRLRDYHKMTLQPVILPWLELRSRGIKQPVLDFLFEYYSFAPGKIMTWNPGFNTVTPKEWVPSDRLYRLTSQGWLLQKDDFPQKRLSTLDWLIELHQAILDKPKAFGCYGLHEWAMVYSTDEIRHQQLPLRLPHEEIDAFVKSQTIRCSHFDAFRFFTPAAKPLNRLQPNHNSRIVLEQGGCIHANMDLYKWCYKLWPWLSSDLLAKAFLLAVDTRYFDMQASPYDLSDYDIEPVRIETEEGRKEYICRQMEIAQRAEILRKEQLTALKLLNEWLKKKNP
jgi:hypothetical protein